MATGPLSLSDSDPEGSGYSQDELSGFQHAHYLSRSPEAHTHTNTYAPHVPVPPPSAYHHTVNDPRVPVAQHYGTSPLPYPTNVSYAEAQPPYFTPQNALGASTSQDVTVRGYTNMQGFASAPYALPVADTDVPQSEPRSTTPAASQSGRGRREKPRIELAADQPLTTQGKPRVRVFVACVQCRSRKIRCDGAKPMCHNCSRRTDSDGQCTYDASPKRRGPDKYPGARQRMTSGGGAADRPRRRTRRREPSGDPSAGVTAASTQGADEGTSQHHSDLPFGQSQQTHPGGLTFIQESFVPHLKRDFQPPPPHIPAPHSFSPAPSISSPTIVGRHRGDAGVPYPPSYYDSEARPSYQYGAPLGSDSHASQSGIAPYSVQRDSGPRDVKPTIAPEPSLQFTRETWWDALLSLYSVPLGQPCSRLAPLTPGARESVTQRVAADLQGLFRSSMYWFSFLHLPRFFGRMLDPTQRPALQPSLILSTLALATFMRSAEERNGQAALMRDRALRLMEEAQGALEASVAAGWIDTALVQASWMIAFFEISAHPHHSTARVQSSMQRLDSLIEMLQITQLDRDDPRVSAAGLRTDVPAGRHQHSRASWAPTYPSGIAPAPHPPPVCACQAYTLGQGWPQSSELAPRWTMTPLWREDWSEGEVRKEECRRVVWSTVTLAAGHSNYTAVNPEIPPLDLHIMDAANYALLLPGESLAQPNGSPDTHALFRESVWALYMQVMQLWHSCLRVRGNGDISDADKAQFAVNAWLSLDAIEDALGRHTCGAERAFLFQGREYIFNTRMCISYEFQRYIPQITANTNPYFHRRHAEDWLNHQAAIVKRSVANLQPAGGQTPTLLSKRPLFIFWFMSQISRSLSLWQCDQTLTLALEVATSLLIPVDYLMVLWPCQEQRRRYHVLRNRLADACRVAGLPPPPAYGAPR